MVIFPSVNPSNESWECIFNQQTSVSPITGNQKEIELPGAKWRASLPFTYPSHDDARLLAAFVMAMRGQTGRTKVTPYAAKTILGDPSGSPTVNGAGQTGGTLATQSWPIDTTVLRAGDYFEVNGELKMVTADATTDASGEVTISFSPNLHESPPAAEPIIYTNPTCTMKLANPSQAAWQLSQRRIYVFNLELVEAID